jgi:branched-subunit amino acid ABC-type transport system permease component
MIATILSGVALGGIYTLVAIGYNITWLTARSINFAQGALIAAGTFITIDCYNHHIPLVLTFMLLAASGAVIALVEYLIAIRPVQRRGPSSRRWCSSAVARLSSRRRWPAYGHCAARRPTWLRNTA